MGIRRNVFDTGSRRVVKIPAACGRIRSGHCDAGATHRHLRFKDFGGQNESVGRVTGAVLGFGGDVQDMPDAETLKQCGHQEAKGGSGATEDSVTVQKTVVQQA